MNLLVAERVQLMDLLMALLMVLNLEKLLDYLFVCLVHLMVLWLVIKSVLCNIDVLCFIVQFITHSVCNP